jgi:cytochrome b561
MATRSATQSIERYSTVAIALHWIIGLAALGLVAGGLFMTSLERSDPLRAIITQFHMSMGLTILVLTVVRIVWRLTHRPPALPAGMSGFERIAAKATHGAFYLLLILIPMSGWVFTSVAPGAQPLQWFGLFPWPLLPAPPGDQGAIIAGRVRESHELLAFVMLGLAAVHIGAALRHHFVLKDGLLARMGLGRQS